MDLSQFRTSSTSSLDKSRGGSNGNIITRKFAQAKNWLYPPITTQRQLRMQQYRDFSVFLGAIITVAYFENKIRAYLEIDTDLSKMGPQGQF